MIRLVIFSAALSFCSTESSKSSIRQRPTALITNPGAQVQINCSHSDSKFNMIQWYKQSAGDKPNMALIGYTRFTSSVVEDAFKDDYKVSGDGQSVAHLHIPQTGPEDSALYFCSTSEATVNREAYFGTGTKLTVLEENHDITPPKVEVLEPSPSECSQDKKKTLVCVASEFYPDHVTVYWQVNGINVTKGVATDNNAKRVEKFYTITSRLMVDEKEWHTVDTEFKCIVNFFDGKNNIDYPASVSGKKDDAMTRERYLRITQGAKLSYGVFIVKSCLYGAFVAFLVWKLQKSSGKLKN